MASKKKIPIADIKSAPMQYRETKEDRERQRKWAAEDGLRTIQQAEKIKNDKQLMSDIKALATEQVSNLKKFCK